MNRIVLWYVLTCCGLFAVTTALAQENILQPHGDGMSRRSSSKTPIAIGIDAGINYSFFSQSISAEVLQALPALKVFESGSGIAPLVQAYVDIGIHRSVGIQLKIGYDAKKFGNEETNTQDCEVLGGSSTIATINNEYTTSPAFIALGVLARIDLTERFVGTIGPIVHFASGKPLQKVTRTIQSPDNCYFNIGTPEQSRSIHAEGEIESTTSPRFGMELGLGYKIPLTPSITLVPKAGFQFFFSKAFDEKQSEDGQTSAANARLHSAQFSIGLLFGL